MLKTIALVVLLALAAVLIFAATRPDTFRVTRSATIKAPPEKIFPLVSDFKQVLGVIFFKPSPARSSIQVPSGFLIASDKRFPPS